MNTIPPMKPVPSIYGPPSDNRNREPVSPVRHGGGLKCPACHGHINRHVPERCPECLQPLVRAEKVRKL